jgi:cell wall assembly regulator SMI1
MSKKTKQRPVETLRDGAIKAAIWKNESEKGAFFSVTFARTYKDKDGDLQDTESFSGSQLLRLARLADKAYERTAKLAQAERAKDDTEEDEAAA